MMQMKLEMETRISPHIQLFEYVNEYVPALKIAINDTLILESTVAVEKLLQLEKSIINRRFHEYIAPESVDMFYTCMNQAHMDISRKTCQIKLCRKEDSIWVSVVIDAIKDREQVCITIMDVSQHRQEIAVMQNRIKEIVKKNQELSSQLLLVQEEERQNLATDIHNNLGQLVTVMAMLLDRLRKLSPRELAPILDEIETQKMEVIQQIRNLCNYLSMHMLRDLGLSEALSDFFQKIQNSTSLRINFQCNELEPRPSRIVESSIFHIIRDIIADILKHANTNEVDISLEAADKVLKLYILTKENSFESDSTKFNLAGIKGIYERAEILGAYLNLKSSPGKGTMLTAEFPLSS